MKNERLTIFVSYLMLFFMVSVSLADDEEKSDHGQLRLENEYKLVVPENMKDQVWEYLKNEGRGFLKTLDPQLTSTLSDEIFHDIYYDSEKLNLLKNDSGIRWRRRFIPGNESHRKNGRSLIQLKLNDHFHNNQLTRSEFKYPVLKNWTQIDSSSPINLIKEKKRTSFIEKVKSIGLDPYELKDILALKQRRRRVYVNTPSGPLITLTLDDVSSRKLWFDCRFTEIELEINEVNYTLAQGTQRELMEKMNKAIKDHLLLKFPAIVQDQTPKYNKVYNCFSQKIVFYKYLSTYL